MTYFVISGNADTSRFQYPRTPYETEVDAVTRATKILEGRGTAAKGERPTPPLWIVKLVKVVEIAPPPIRVREPTPEDVMKDG